MIEGIYRVWREWIRRYPFIAKVYHLFSWLSLLVLVISLVLIEESRTMLVQYLWSFYVLPILVAQPKQNRCLEAGQLVCSLRGSFGHSLDQWEHAGTSFDFGGRTTDTWSFAVMTPIVEKFTSYCLSDCICFQEEPRR